MTKPKHKVWDKVVYKFHDWDIYTTIQSVFNRNKWYKYVVAWYVDFLCVHEKDIRKPTQEELDLYYND